MAQQWNWARFCNAPWSVKTCDPRFLSRRILYLHMIRKNKRSIGAMKYIPTYMSFLFSAVVSLSLIILQRRPICANRYRAAMSFWRSWLVLSAMYRCKRRLLDARWPIRVMHWSIRRSHLSGPASCLLRMLMDWAIAMTRSLTVLSICCVMKPPLFFQIPIVSAAHWLTPIPAFPAQMRTCRVGIRIVLASATTDFGNQEASHYNWGSQRLSVIEWWISNGRYSKQA